jgi:hypothetical protein
MDQFLEKKVLLLLPGALGAQFVYHLVVHIYQLIYLVLAGGKNFTLKSRSLMASSPCIRYFSGFISWRYKRAAMTSDMMTSASDAIKYNLSLKINQVSPALLRAVSPQTEYI